MSNKEMTISEMMEIVKQERKGTEKYFCKNCKKKLLKIEKDYCTKCTGDKNYER